MARGGDVHNPGLTIQIINVLKQSKIEIYNINVLKPKTKFLYAKKGSYSVPVNIIFAQEGEVKKEMWDNGQRV